MNRSKPDFPRLTGLAAFPMPAIEGASSSFLRRSSRLQFSLCLGLFAVLGWCRPGYSQSAPEQNTAPAEASGQKSEDPDLQGSFSRSISFARDREAETRLRGAQTAFATGRSVDGAQILADLLALPEPHHVQIGATLRDVRDEAAHLLRHGSEELREQFRRQTEVKAAEELKNALADSNFAAVSAIASRYPFTPVARECVETLAMQLYDHARFDAVTLTASRWIEQSPSPDQAASESPRLLELWISALNALGDREGATGLTARFASPDVSPSDSPQTPVAQQLEPGGVPFDRATPWTIRSELPAMATELIRTALNNLSRQGVHPALSTKPLVLKQHIVWRSLTEIICIERATGKVLWRNPIADPLIDDTIQLGETKPDGNRTISLRTQLGHRVLRNSILGQLTSDGERVYAVEYLPATKFLVEPQTPNNARSQTDRMPIPEITFVAYSLVDGSIQWKSHEVWGEDKSRDTYLLGPPVAQGRSLYAAVQRQEQLLILSMDRETGALDGASVLGEVPHLADDRRRLSEACSVVFHNGVAICATGAGGIAAFDLYRGQLQWGYRHSRDDVVISQGLLMPPVDKAGWSWMTGWEQPQLVRFGTNLIYGTPESHRIRCLDIASGDLKWEVPVAGTRAIVGGDDERVILEGSGVTRSLWLKDGHLEREYFAPSTITSAIWLGAECRLILEDGRHIDWTPRTGETVAIQSHTENQPWVHKAGTLHRIRQSPDRATSRGLLVGGQPMIVRMDELSLRPANEEVLATPPGDRFPSELVWQPGQTEQWLASLTEWIEKAPADEQPARVLLALQEWARALESESPPELPINEWTTRWSLAPEQVREISLLSLRHAMRTGIHLSALRHVLRLLELQPAEWEIELSHASWSKQDALTDAFEARTVRLDTALCGVLQELWEQASPDQRRELDVVYRDWAERKSTVLDGLTLPLEQLSFLPQPAKERPLQWKTLGELARQQLSLRHLSTHEDRTTAAAALWRLVELHMARGEWGNAAALIEELKRRFASVAVRGDQTAEELVRQFPESSLVLKNIDRDRRTTWPEREPIVSLIESYRNPEIQHPIPVRAERGSLFDQLNLTYAFRELKFSGLGKVSRSWKLTVPGGGRNLWQQYAGIKAGWAFGQFVVVQFGSELLCVSSLDSKGEAKTSRLKEVMLWPTVNKNVPLATIDTLGNEDNGLSFEDRPIPQVVGFVRREIEPFDSYGHRVAWVGPVSAGSLCFLQQGMLVCLDTATGQELWRRYDVPAGSRTLGDDSMVVMLKDGSQTVELLNPLDGRTLRTYESEHLAEEWIRNWGRNALVASGQPAVGTVLNPTAVATGSDAKTAQSAESDSLASAEKELRLKMVDLAGARTVWDRTFPPGSVAFEVDEDWVGVLSKDGAIHFLEVLTGQTVRQSKVTLPPGLTQIATAVTERSIFVTLSPPVTENALTGSKPTKLRPRQFYVNGPVHAFDRQTGEYQWSQQIENRVFPIDQVRDVPLLICADVWKGPLDSLPEVGETLPKRNEPDAKSDESDSIRVRYWALDTRTGRVVLNTAVNKSTVQYTVERNLAEAWVEIRQDESTFRFSYADEKK